MTPNIPQAVRELIAEYRRFLKTSYRFLDDHLRRQFEEHLDRTDVTAGGPYVTLARDLERGRTLVEIAREGGLTSHLLKARWPLGEERLFWHQEQRRVAGRGGKARCPDR